MLILKFYPGMKCLHVFFSFFHPVMKFHPCLFDRVFYTWHFIPGWNSSRDEIIPVYGEMSPTVYTFLPRWNFILGWTHPCQKDRNEISTQDEKKMCKHFIPGWNFKMSISFKNFWRMYSNMLSKINVFEHNESINIMKHKASL